METNRREIEDAIKDLWIATVEEKKRIITASIEPDILETLVRGGYVKVEGDLIKLTDRGEELGRKIVRLHRLAERLLLDVLDMEEEIYEKASCSVEHAITEELEEAICTLLGHPKVCPHGKKIPPGKCCKKREETFTKVVYTLAELSPGDEGRVCYLASDRLNLVSRLLNMGIVPGSRVKLVRKSPSYIIQIGNTQVAFDEYIAKSIYIIKYHRKI